LSNHIFQKGIDENWEAALEHNPEAFARVVCVDFVPRKLPPLSPHPRVILLPFAHGVVYSLINQHLFFYLIGYAVCGYGGQWSTFEGI
jgi:hypothetical protein